MSPFDKDPMRDVPLTIPSRDRHRRVRVALGMLVLLGMGLLACAAWLMWPGDAFDVPSTQSTPGAAPAPAPAGSTAQAPLAGTPGGLTGGIDPARLFELGVAGDLQLDHHTKAALDNLATGLGPRPHPDTLAAVAHALRAGLPRDAAAQALALLQAYRGYQQALTDASAARSAPRSVADMRALLDADAALRRQHFDDSTAQALFGSEEAYARYAVEVQAIETDPQLSATEKARRLQSLQSALTPTPSFEGAEEVAERVAAVRHHGGTEVQVQAVRMQYLRPDLAAGLGDIEYQPVVYQQVALRDED